MEFSDSVSAFWSRRMPATGKRSNPVHDTPPKVTEKRTKEAQQVTCLICDVRIIESTNDVDGDDAVYCEGDCKAWLHRKCVSMSKLLYDKISDSDDSYYCPNCATFKHLQEISILRNQVKDLTDELASIKTLKQKVVDLEKELSLIKDRPPSSSPTSSNFIPATPAINSSANQQKNSGTSPDRKFNLIIQGIPECSPNMKRFERFQSDQQNVLKELTNLDDSLNPSCVKDTFRLGKYKKDSNRPRPILVKFLRSCDVQSILSKRNSLKTPISIKPDMTIEERDNEKFS